jgi:hypothetical protein
MSQEEEVGFTYRSTTAETKNKEQISYFKVTFLIRWEQGNRTVEK